MTLKHLSQVKPYNMAATLARQADRGRCYYRRQTLRETAELTHDCFSAQEARQRHYWLDPSGKHHDALRSLSLQATSKELNWYIYIYIYIFTSAQKQTIGFITQRKNWHCRPASPTEHLNYLIEIVTCGDNNKSIFEMNRPQGCYQMWTLLLVLVLLEKILLELQYVCSLCLF